MADRERQSPRSRSATTPEDYSTFASSSPPGGDYKLTVDLVATVNRELGGLTAEVNALKDQVREHTAELKSVSQDIHTAKTTVKTAAKIIGWLLAGFLAFSGWAINKAVDAYVSSHQQSASQQK